MEDIDTYMDGENQNYFAEEEKRELKDGKRISELVNKRGFRLTAEECRDIWQAHSLDFHAGWLSLDKEDENLAKTAIKLINESKNKGSRLARILEELKEEDGH